MKTYGTAIQHCLSEVSGTHSHSVWKSVKAVTFTIIYYQCALRQDAEPPAAPVEIWLYWASVEQAATAEEEFAFESELSLMEGFAP